MGFGSMTSPNGGQAPHLPFVLPNQGGSFYNITLDEIPSHFSEPVKDMKFNEVTNMQHMQAPTSSSSSSSSNTAPPLPPTSNINGRKTSIEVWQHIMTQEEHGSEENNRPSRDMALDNFLLQASAMNGGYDGRSQSLLAVDPVLQQQANWVQYELDEEKPQIQQGMNLLPSNLPMFGNANGNPGFAESQPVGMSVVSVAMARATSSDSQMQVENNRNDEVIDKSLERRHKRMIKNRESAARSRARKQEYINQLEEQVRQLTDTNKRLKRQKVQSRLLINFHKIVASHISKKYSSMGT